MTKDQLAREIVRVLRPPKVARESVYKKCMQQPKAFLQMRLAELS